MDEIALDVFSSAPERPLFARFLILPTDLITMILKRHLDHATRIMCYFVCKKLYQLLHSPSDFEKAAEYVKAVCGSTTQPTIPADYFAVPNYDKGLAQLLAGHWDTSIREAVRYTWSSGHQAKLVQILLRRGTPAQLEWMLGHFFSVQSMFQELPNSCLQYAAMTGNARTAHWCHEKIWLSHLSGTDVPSLITVRFCDKMKPDQFEIRAAVKADSIRFLSWLLHFHTHFRRAAVPIVFGPDEIRSEAMKRFIKRTACIQTQPSRIFVVNQPVQPGEVADFIM